MLWRVPCSRRTARAGRSVPGESKATGTYPVLMSAIRSNKKTTIAAEPEDGIHHLALDVSGGEGEVSAVDEPVAVEAASAFHRHASEWVTGSGTVAN